MDKRAFFEFARENREKADNSFRNCNYLDACEYYFYAGEAFEYYGNKLLSAECYKMSFISNINSSELLKDIPEKKYLGNMETILIEENRLDLLESSLHKLETALNGKGYFLLSSKYYLKKMSYRKKRYFKECKFIKWMIHNIWGLTSKYGESYISWLGTFIAITIVYSIIYLPSPYKFMESIYIADKEVHLETFLDYFYFSLITLTTWDWNCISPLNTCGQLIITFRFFLGVIMCGLLISILSKKFTRR